MKYLNHEAYVDKGRLSLLVGDDGTKHLNYFAMTLPKTRKLFACFSPDRGLSAFCRRHDEAFAHLGGVPREIWYAPSFLIVTTGPNRITIREGLQAYASEQGFLVRLIPLHRLTGPARPEYGLRHLCRTAASRRWASVDELNRALRNNFLIRETGVAASPRDIPRAAARARRQAHVQD